MNKKVFISMLVLCVTFLCGLYVAKIFFPQEFVMVIENENIVKVGEFIDSHAWLYYICTGITAFITYYLYCCASCEKLLLKWYEILEILGVVVSVRVVSFFDDNIATAIETSAFFILPWVMHGKLKNCAIAFTVHGFSQALSLSIRNLPIYLTNVNFATVMLMLLDMYIWQLLCCIIFNYKKKEV